MIEPYRIRLVTERKEAFVLFGQPKHEGLSQCTSRWQERVSSICVAGTVPLHQEATRTLGRPASGAGQRSQVVERWPHNRTKSSLFFRRGSGTVQRRFSMRW